MERRFLSLADNPCRVDKRVGTDPPGSVITGYAAPFWKAENPGTEYQLDGDLSERIMPGCFDRAIRECDIRALFNHNPDNILGRNIAGTLELSVDQVGLRYRISMPDTSFAQDVVTSVVRGDVTGSSFSFLPYAEPDAVVMVHMADGRWVRELRSVQLFDIGPVTFPAYKATTSGARMVGELDPAVRVEWEQAKEAERVKQRHRDLFGSVEEKLTYWRKRY